MVANLWRLVPDVAAADGAILGIVPNEVIAMLSKVLLISGREGGIQSVRKQAFDAGKHGLIIKLELKYCMKPSQGFSGVHLFGAQNAPFEGARNTTEAGASGVLKEQALRPSNFMKNDPTWIPCEGFYSRGHPSDRDESLRSASKYGGIGSPRPYCITCLVRLRQPKHCAIRQGGVPADAIASQFFDAIRAKDGRYCFRSASSLPTGIAVFW